MTFRYPHLDQQFSPRDATSYADCCATSGAILADADSSGERIYNHAQVRAATDEPHPDPQSPGLNWSQVDDALYRLSGGRINLDVHPIGSPFSSVITAVRAGKWAGLAVWRGVLVDAGMAGNSTFRGGHAVVFGYDQDRHKYVLGDTLVPEWQDVAAWLMQSACDRFLTANGYGGGGAYYALTRDVYTAEPSTLRYSAVFTKGSFWRYWVVNGVIQGRVSKRFSSNTSAPCEGPVSLPWPNHGNRKLCRVTKGALKGYYVEPGSSNVKLKVTPK